VVQQNATHAEQGADASLELNAQAEQMSPILAELVALMNGRAGDIA
jgi:hypothetical protein